MAPCYYRVVTSKVLKFLVGPDHEEFVIHSEVLRYNSSPWLDADSGDFTAEESFIIEDVDMRIFGLACEFLYTGDYSIAPNDSPPPSETALSRQEHAEQQAIILKGTIVEGLESVKEFPDYPIRKIETHPIEGSQGSHHPTLNSTEVLLTHACLHVFASKYKMQELHEASLFKLLNLLHALPLHDCRVGDLVILFSFAFETESGMSENMRKSLIQYAARHFKLFLRNREFQIFLQGQPSLATELLTTLVASL